MTDANIPQPLAGLYRAFAAGPGGGNVAGVVLAREELTSDVMQAVARDFAAPTTGFVSVAALWPCGRIHTGRVVADTRP